MIIQEVIRNKSLKRVISRKDHVEKIKRYRRHLLQKRKPKLGLPVKTETWK